MDLKEIKKYLKSNNLRLKTTRIASFYRQECVFYTFYNSNELERLITDILPFYSKRYADLVVDTEIDYIGDENMLFDEIRMIQAIDSNGDIKTDLLESIKEILNVIEIAPSNIIYPNFEFSQVVREVSKSCYEFKNKGVDGLNYLRLENGDWRSLSESESGYVKISNNTSIALEIAYIQWSVKVAGEIIQSQIKEIKASLIAKGLKSPMICKIEESIKDLLGFGNYSNSNPLAIFEIDTKITIEQ